MNIRIGSKKEIILPPNLDPYKDSYLKKVMDELTLPNPAYFQAQKYSPYSYTTIQQNLFYYTYNQKDSTLTIPRGFSLENEEILDDFRVKVHADYPNYNLTLRRTQRMAADAYLKAVEGNCGDGVVVIQTGAGKSQTALYIASKLKQKALILVHKDDLVMGWRKDIEFAFGIRPKKIGLIKAKNFRIGEQFTIATVQTLSRMDDETLCNLGKEFGMIIQDEQHHAVATMYTIVHKYFPAFYRYGTTATNMRNDGLEKVLNFYYGNVCYNGKDEDAKEAIIPNDKVYIRKKCSDVVFSADKLVPTSTKRKPIKVEDDEGNELLIELVYRGQSNRIIALKINDSEPIPIDNVEEPLYTYLVYKGYITEKPADYHEAKRTVIDSKDFNEMVVMDVIKEAGVKRKSCLVFCSEKEHIEVLRDMFIDKGYSLLLQLYYGNSTDKKEDIKQNAESRQKLITLATYAIATEGTNVKAWERMFMAMPVANEKDLIQAIGRVRRTNKGKEDCIIYDYQFPYVDMMAQQSRKRDAVYRKYKFVVESTPRDSSLQRGFPRR